MVTLAATSTSGASLLRRILSRAGRGRFRRAPPRPRRGGRRRRGPLAEEKVYE